MENPPNNALKDIIMNTQTPKEHYDNLKVNEQM